MQVLTEKCLTTLLTEVEGILISRPLFPLMLHDSERKPLTSNHLLLLRGNPNLLPGTFDTNSCYIHRLWAQVQFLANQIWRRCQRIPSLSFAAAKMVYSRGKFQSRGCSIVGQRYAATVK